VLPLGDQGVSSEATHSVPVQVMVIIITVEAVVLVRQEEQEHQQHAEKVVMD